MRPTFQQRMLAIPASVRVPLILFVALPGIALSVYWWATYSGFYRVLIEWQSKTFGGYLPVYTGILMVGVVGVFPAILTMTLLVLLNVFPVDPDNPPPVPTGGAAADLWLQQNQGFFVLCIAGVMGVIAGPVILFLNSMDPLKPLDLATLEAGQKPLSSFVTARGRLLEDRAVSQTDRGLETRYVPLVSPNWREGAPIRLYVSIPQLRRDEAKKGEFKGIVYENGLPGPIRTSFEKSPFARPDSSGSSRRGGEWRWRIGPTTISGRCFLSATVERILYLVRVPSFPQTRTR
jgi:hypothetical protein